MMDRDDPRDNPPAYDFVQLPKNYPIPPNEVNKNPPTGGSSSQPEYTARNQQHQPGYPRPPKVYLQAQPGSAQLQTIYTQPAPGIPGYTQSTIPPPEAYNNSIESNDIVWGTRSTAVNRGDSTFLLGDTPTTVTCPSCNHEVMTSVRTVPDMRTQTFAWLMCFFCLPFLWIPFCVESCQTQKHFCSECGCFIGMYRA